MIRNTCSVRLCHGPLSLPRNVSVVFAMRRILCADSGTGGKGPRYSASVSKGVLQLRRESVGIERPGPAAKRHVDIVIARDEEYSPLGRKVQRILTSVPSWRELLSYWVNARPC